MSLAPPTVNGIPYPAGSLFRTDVSDIRKPGRHENTIIGSRQLSRVAMMRLSLHAVPTPPSVSGS